MEDRLKTILYNAISLLIDETFEQYDNEEVDRLQLTGQIF